MLDPKTIIDPEILQLQQKKEQGAPSSWDFPDILGLQKVSAHELLERRRFKHVAKIVTPVHEKLGKIMLGDRARSGIFEIRDDLGALLETVHGWEKEQAPDRSEGLFFYAAYSVTQVHLPEGRPALMEGRGGGESDELVTERNELKVANAELTRRVSDLIKDRDLLHAALTARNDGQLRMTESYEGIVRHVGRDDVVVLFEVDDDLVEHTYTRDQFVDSRLPDLGDRLAVYVHVAQLPPEESAEGADKAMEGIDEQPRRRRNIGPPPREV